LLPAQHCDIVDTDMYLNNTQATHFYTKVLPYTIWPILFYKIFVSCPKCFGFSDIFNYINNLIGRFSSPSHLRNLVRY